MSENNKISQDELKRLDLAIRDVLNNCELGKSRLAVFRDVKVDEYGTPVVELSGGLNGRGEWDDYFDDLAAIVRKAREEKKLAMWLVASNVDCLDDMFSMTFGLRFLAA